MYSEVASFCEQLPASPLKSRRKSVVIAGGGATRIHGISTSSSASSALEHGGLQARVSASGPAFSHVGEYTKASNSCSDAYAVGKDRVLPRVNALPKKLPETAYILRVLLQDDAALLAILRGFGGQTLRVPARWPWRGDNNALHQMLSEAQMKKIVAHFGGTDLYIPKCARYVLQLRNACIIQNYSKATQNGVSSGEAVQQLARQNNLSDRRIWGILKCAVSSEI